MLHSTRNGIESPFVNASSRWSRKCGGHQPREKPTDEPAQSALCPPEEVVKDRNFRPDRTHPARPTGGLSGEQPLRRKVPSN